MCVYLCEEEEEKCYGQNRIAGFGGLNEILRVQCVITIYTELVLLHYCLHLGTGNRITHHLNRVWSTMVCLSAALI